MPKKAAKKGKKEKKAKKAKQAKILNSVTTLEKDKSLPKLPPVIPVVCQSNKYPGLMEEPTKIAVLGVIAANYSEMCELMKSGFAEVDRLMLMTPWSNYAVFRESNGEQDVYFLNDGCCCTQNIFRFYNLKEGTAGFLYFQSIHEVITYILESRFKREKYKHLAQTGAIERLCSNFCTQGGADIFKICNRRGEICNMDDYYVKELLFPRCKQRCNIKSVDLIEREMSSFVNQNLFRRLLERRESRPKMKCK